MPVDSPAKRLAALLAGDEAVDLLPRPDGTVAVADRATLHGFYGEPSTVAPPPSAAPVFSDVVIVDRDDLTVVRATLDDRRAGAGFQKIRNTPGTGKVVLSNDDPALGFARYGDLIRFDIDDTTEFLSIIENKRKADVDQAEEAGQATQLDGRGHLAVVRRALVFPQSSPGIIPVTDTRTFAFASADLDDSGFTGTVTSGALDPDLQPLPKGWRDFSALKIWVDWGVYDGDSPPLDVFLRGEDFTVDDDGTFELQATADDGFEIRIDDVPVLSETRPFLWQETKKTRIFLAAGTHTRAIKGTNLVRPGNEATNIGWVLATLFETTDGGRNLGSVVWNTEDSTWIGTAPATPPGFTLGRVLRVVLEEWEARGGLTIARTFSDSVDSGGISWPVSPDFAFRIGDDLLMVLGQLVEAGVVNVSMTPGAYELNAYIDDSATSATVFESTGDVDTSNITELAHQGTIA